MSRGDVDELYEIKLMEKLEREQKLRKERADALLKGKVPKKNKQFPAGGTNQLISLADAQKKFGAVSADSSSRSRSKSKYNRDDRPPDRPPKELKKKSTRNRSNTNNSYTTGPRIVKKVNSGPNRPAVIPTPVKATRTPPRSNNTQPKGPNKMMSPFGMPVNLPPSNSKPSPSVKKKTTSTPSISSQKRIIDEPPISKSPVIMRNPDAVKFLTMWKQFKVMNSPPAMISNFTRNKEAIYRVYGIVHSTLNKYRKEGRTDDIKKLEPEVRKLQEIIALLS